MPKEPDQFSFQKPTEKSIVKAILRYLNTQPGFHWKTHGGAFSGKSGMPDVFYLEKRKNGGCLFLAMEVKVPGGKPTKLQAETLDQLRSAGAIATVVTSREEVKALLDNLRK